MDLDEYGGCLEKNNNYNLSVEAIDSFFLNEFKPPAPIIRGEFAEHYIFNSEGFRSDEFESNPDILFSGCSCTLGAGITLEHLWTKKVSDYFNVKHQNLGVPGSSTMLIVSNLFEYFRRYGNPKILVCLFPDPYRTFRIKNYQYGYSKYDNAKNYILSQGQDYIADKNSYYENIQKLHIEMDGPKILKLPTQIEDIIQPDTSYYLSMMSINILEQYCLSNNIKFIWSTWQGFHMNSLKIVKKRNPERFPGLIDLNCDRWHVDFDNMIEFHYDSGQANRNEIKCHRDLFELDQELFHIGFDKHYGAQGAHWGTHRHRHIADKFIEAISKIKDV